MRSLKKVGEQARIWSRISGCSVKDLQSGVSCSDNRTPSIPDLEVTVLGGVDWLQTTFWAVFPDLAAFVPIGTSSGRREWPSWGANLYNGFHTVLVWGLAFSST